jgi:hypothetical protein
MVRMPAELRADRSTRVGRVDYREQPGRGAFFDDLMHPLEDCVVDALVRLIAGNQASMAVGGDDGLRWEVPGGKR